jgi:hypothetical protein
MTNFVNNGRSRAASDVVAFATSNTTTIYFEKHGAIIGGIFSIIWTISVLLSIYLIKNMNNENAPNKKYYWLVSIFLSVIVLVANGYYFGFKNKANEEELNEIRLYYAHISLIPIWLVIITVFILIVFNLYS